MLNWEAGGQLWMLFVYHISSFLLVPIVGLTEIKHRQTERETGQHRRQQKEGKAWQCYSTRQEETPTINIHIYVTF